VARWLARRRVVLGGGSGQPHDDQDAEDQEGEAEHLDRWRPVGLSGIDVGVPGYGFHVD
jgi:hypothetical protein